MKKILIVYHQMCLGGSTTSLLSLLAELPPEKYNVDLLLLYPDGTFDGDIPPYVNVLPYAHRFRTPRMRRLSKMLRPRYLWMRFKAVFISKKYGSDKAGEQYAVMSDADLFRRVKGEYDTAISFIEGYPMLYISRHVRAKKKIAWYHIDYAASGYFPEFDLPDLERIDSIVTVSEECRRSFCECFPSLAGKCTVIENILSRRRLEELAAREVPFTVDKDKLNLITVCRISFASKALDRAVNAVAELQKTVPSGQFDRLRWYIVGDGPDLAALKRLIAERGLENTVILLGMKLNPYPYIKPMSLFFLPSLWEGKPMAVTEALILGLPALVTEYASARGQIQDGEDGIIVPNDSAGILRGLEFCLSHPDGLAVLRANVARRDYSNPGEIEKVMTLID